jgi:predicted cobalt transporter CbtA
MMSVVTAARYPGAVLLAGRSSMPDTGSRSGTFSGKVVVAFLIVCAVLGLAPALPSMALQDTASSVSQTTHIAAARARQENQQQLTSCLHHAHRSSVDPAGCRTE